MKCSVAGYVRVGFPWEYRLVETTNKSNTGEDLSCGQDGDGKVESLFFECDGLQTRFGDTTSHYLGAHRSFMVSREPLEHHLAQ